jgi:hypothetical protein
VQLREPVEAALAAGRLRAEGITVVPVVQPVSGDLRETQAAMARALRLPDPAAVNLDAFLDTLRDRQVWWRGESVALLWHDAWRLRERNETDWHLFLTVLDAARLPVVAVLREPAP